MYVYSIMQHPPIYKKIFGGLVMYHSLCQEQKLGYHHSEEPTTVQNYD